MKGTSCFIPPKFLPPVGLGLSDVWAHFEVDHGGRKGDGKRVAAG